MTNQTISQQYAVEFCNPEPKYYTRIPHILPYLTYDHVDEKTGKITIKKLSVFAQHFYTILKSIANDNSACWMNRNNLAELAGMSIGQVTNCKRELAQKFHQLDGNPLIILEKCQKTIYEDEKKVNKTFYDKMWVVDIWRWNNGFKVAQKHLKKLEEKQEQGHQMTLPEGQGHQMTLPLEGARSPYDTNNNPINKNPMFKEQQPVGDPLRGSPTNDCFLNSKEFVCQPTEKVVTLQEHKKSFDWLISQGCGEKVAKSICSKYTPQELEAACKYILELTKKKKPPKIKNKWAYFTTVLQERYWEKK